VVLDTGLRASEVCALDVGDVDLKSGQVRVKHGDPGGAKGGKGRVVYLGKAARRALWRYLSSRADGADADAPLFVGKLHRRMDKGLLRQLIVRLGEKAGVAHAHPHRFRHTFALTYLRAGGDVFTLQALLGHRTLEMVQHYARLAQVDTLAPRLRALDTPAANGGGQGVAQVRVSNTLTGEPVRWITGTYETRVRSACLSAKRPAPAEVDQGAAVTRCPKGCCAMPAGYVPRNRHWGVYAPPGAPPTHSAAKGRVHALCVRGCPGGTSGASGTCSTPAGRPKPFARAASAAAGAGVLRTPAARGLAYAKPCETA
jgi:hypothetical protein